MKALGGAVACVLVALAVAALLVPPASGDEKPKVYEVTVSGMT